ncbi:hypothetical protein B0T16DRAFT_457038 [Cercophora newfieldiana]|uniref:ubiquitinyl hydrolase 1 n=1 Tax=Cercophora newfieldiana TaxID=92897 RepID=A0AA39YCZ4_9PEZI|nr:hypothetical protein B0T16DRAFT_457038 [Cercophora newfieldiana]
MDLVPSIYDHLVLPPKLPGGDKGTAPELSQNALTRLIDGCQRLISLTPHTLSKTFEGVYNALVACREINGRSFVDKTSALNYFRNIDSCGVLILWVAEQNAALLVYAAKRQASRACRPEEAVVFEAFEASAPAEHVLAAGNAMRRDFPGRSAQLSTQDFADASFQQHLADLLEQASMESLPSLRAHARKAGVAVAESRDTTDPALVTHMLMPLLETMGRQAQVPVLRKRVRDDVSLNHADVPWRRLPFWLVLRVGTLRQLCHTAGDHRGRACYKFLMCIVLAQLLQDSAGRLSPDKVLLLRAKLCRRMAKLEMERTAAEDHPEGREVYDCLFDATKKAIDDVVREATDRVEVVWKNVQRASVPRIPRLPLRATGDALRLSLPFSGRYLDRLLLIEPAPNQPPVELLQLPRPLDVGIQEVQGFTGRIALLAKAERRIQQASGEEAPGMNMTTALLEWRCLDSARQIQSFVSEMGPMPEWDPEQNSALALCVFELWARMDSYAVEACPLLANYRPIFPPELLDVLQLPTLSAMRRLHRVQTHLVRRHQQADSSGFPRLDGRSASKATHAATIFDRTRDGCLAARLVASSSAMKQLESRIQKQTDDARRAKETEWRQKCYRYDQLSEEIQQGICVCTIDECGRKDISGCHRCQRWRTRQRLGITVHEDYLPPPGSPAQRAAVLFELGQPQYLSAYRDATWLIFITLAHPSRPAKPAAAKKTLAQSDVLARHRNSRQPPSRITLGSRKKCFLQTHYRISSARSSLSEVLLPLAAEFELYDTATGLWVRELDKTPTLQHLCGVLLPKALLSSATLPDCPHPDPIVEGPSSYQIQANQTACPPSMSVHEFSACQKLLGGTHRRWPNVLVELGSINLNLGSEETARLICQLAMQAGPRATDQAEGAGGRHGEREAGAEAEAASCWRAAHAIFRDEPVFAERLLEQIETRLATISSNWRETWCMETLMSLTLRVFYLSADLRSREKAAAALGAMRETTLAWIVRLRHEMQAAADADAADRTAAYAFSAALLSRRTLTITHIESGSPLLADELAAWVRASVALQENLLVSVDKLPPGLRAMLVRDTKAALQMERLLRAAVKAHPSSVGSALSDTLPSLLGSAFSDLEWTFLPSPGHNWIRAEGNEVRTAAGLIYNGQVIHLHLIEGHLLVNGRPRSRLPARIRNDPDVKELFENRHLLTYPSVLPGMTHQLVGFHQNQTVHFGTRSGQAVVIQAVTREGALLEFIPRRVFYGPRVESNQAPATTTAMNTSTTATAATASNAINVDLPLGLVENCCHWLNKSTRQVEIRRKPAIWIARLRDWALYVPERYAQRANVRLVDPHSSLFGQMAGMLAGFEQPEKLTVFQPLAQRGQLSVEMRHLELSLFVNENGLLEFRELKAEMDPNQDAGTWYGLEGKLVLRNTANPIRRSVIVPLGGLSARRRGVHVAVRLNTDSAAYAKFDIDDTLGRLSCPPEPRLLYTKALCHALTSFCVPDPLTGRNGTEEAIQILRSPAAQPWASLDEDSKLVLKRFMELLPVREYYPPGLRRFQTVTWDSRLTTTIQHDGFEAPLRDIFDKSDSLAKFEDKGRGKDGDHGEEEEEENTGSDRHAPLRLRAASRRLLYERQWAIYDDDSDSDESEDDQIDAPYHGRDLASRVTPQSKNVAQIARAIYQQPFSLPPHHSGDAASLLKGWPRIGGFSLPTAAAGGRGPLIARIETPVGDHWAELVRFCQASRGQRTPVLFRLALLAFAPDPDMEAIYHLAAFACVPKLQRLGPPPPCDGYWDLGLQGPISVETLETLIAAAYVPFQPPSSRKAKARARAELARVEHQEKCAAEGSKMARLLRERWAAPWPAVTSEVMAGTWVVRCICVASALESVRPEWEQRHRNRELASYVTRVQAIFTDVPRACPALFASSVDSTPAEPEAWLAIPDTACCPHKAVVPRLSGQLAAKRGPDVASVHATAALLLFLENAHRESEGDPRLGTPRVAPDLASELMRIFKPFAGSSDDLRTRYGRDLLESLTALQAEAASTESMARVRARFAASGLGLDALDAAADEARGFMTNLGSRLWEALAADDARFPWLEHGGLWPCANTPTSLLSMLRLGRRRRRRSRFGPGMKTALVAYGLAIARVQKLERLRSALRQSNERAIGEELRNPGHENWDPAEHTAWLLMELDGNFLVRAEQVEVALAMIAPQSGRNTVLQMNMGQGKTSCIVPMAVAELADGEHLVRLVVPKPLLLQTAQTVQARLGDLVGCEVRHVAFSRRTPTTPSMLDLYENLQLQVGRSGGLIVTTHEQLLSFKLGGKREAARVMQMVAKAQAEANAAAGRMMAFQDWLEHSSRDLLDEADHTLAVRTQLIYPSGPETTVDGHPFRWLIAEGLLALVAHHLPALQQLFPGSMEVVSRPGGGRSLPMVQFLRDDVQAALHDRIVNDICEERAWFLRPSPAGHHQRRGTAAGRAQERRRRAVRRVLSEEDVSEELLGEAVAAFDDAEHESAAKKLLTARGLLVGRILVLCLGRRWNVQYGLSPVRHPIAVPFEAKGVPSSHAEFGHPDVAIVLTCLAFYYAGLTLAQFLQGLQHVLQSDDPAARYERWMASRGGADDSRLPQALCQWNLINVDDAGQIETLWKHLRHARHVVNDYLNIFVFPTHAKQFSLKLQVSAWDVPLFPRPTNDESGGCWARTTGFSGTNDNRIMLPLTILQDDLPSLRHTNAEVLSYLLQPRNRRYKVAVDSQGRRLSEEGLLHTLQQDKIRILVDAGAYILEMDNRTLAQMWLRIDHGATAAIYFDASSRAWVTYRGVNKEDVPLLATPFIEDLGECLVYLDEAHTRGIDLKLPPDARGGLTLALGQTKDLTVQAAMRLRQLGTTQSITFFAPPEVDRNIRDLCGIPNRTATVITSRHVIRWLLEQTCRSHESVRDLYLSQGMDFVRRTDAAWRYPDAVSDKAQRAGLLAVLQQAETQTLEQLYGKSPRSGAAAAGGEALLDPPPGSSAPPQLRALLDRLRVVADGSNHGRSSSGSKRPRHQGWRYQMDHALAEVEQERQVEVEVEEMRVVQKPPRFQALSFPGLHPAVSRFARDGVLQPAVFDHAFAYLGSTGVGRRFGVRPTASRLFVSREFGKVVKLPPNRVCDDGLLRPVEWIIWSPRTQTALVIIPEEAELVLPIVRAGGGSQADRPAASHLLAYAAPVAKTMLAFNKLTYYSVPALPADHAVPDWFRVELGVLAGRLYADAGECASLARFLRRSLAGTAGGDDEDLEEEEEGGGGGEDGTEPQTGRDAESDGFVESPAVFLLEWLSTRRGGQDVLHTPVGYVCTGRAVREHFQSSA